MPKNPHADFTPTLAGYSGITPFRFWCQTALPLTYDDSLSYYELLNKVVNYLNHTIEDLTNVENNTSELAEAYEQLQKYVNDYFDDIDIEAELRNVLDKMAEDGTLDAILGPLVENQLPGVVDEKIDGVVAGQIDESVAGQIDESVADQLPTIVEENVPGVVSGWLTENVNPVGSAVVVDSSLTISGAAADAKVAGDEVSNLKTQLNTVVTGVVDTNAMGFAKGSITTTGVYEPNKEYRICTPNIYDADLDIIFKPLSGFRLSVEYFNGNTVDHLTGWMQTPVTVTSGSRIKVLIGRVTEDESETANVSEFLSNVVILSKYNYFAEKENEAIYNGDYTFRLQLTSGVPLGNYSVGDVVDITPIMNLSPLSSGGFHYTTLIENLIPGETYVINTTDGTSTRPWAFLDKDNKLISMADGAFASNITLTVPNNAVSLIVQSGLPAFGSAKIQREFNADTIKKELEREKQKNDDRWKQTLGVTGVYDGDYKDKLTLTAPVLLGNYTTGNVVDLSPLNISGTHYTVLIGNIAENEVFSINAIDGATARPWAFLDKDNKLLSMASGAIANNVVLTAPKNAEYLLVQIGTVDSSYYENSYINRILNLENAYTGVLDIYTGDYKKRLIKTDPVLLGNYQVGDVVDIQPLFKSGSAHYTVLIKDVIPGEEFFVNSTDGHIARPWAFLDKDNKLVSMADDAYATNTILKVPVNAVYLIIQVGSVHYSTAQIIRYNSFTNYDKRPEINALNKYDNIINKLENASNSAKYDTNTAVKNRANLLNLIHFSDIHGDTTNIRRLLEFYELYETYIHDVIHTGDSVAVYYGDANPFASVGGDDIMNVIGNHDCWIQGDTWPSPYNATAQQAYEKFIAPYIDNWGVTSPGANLCYYYKDYSTAKTRVIVLDCIHYDAAQETWFASVLADAITNELRVVAINHYPAQTGITGFECTFNSITQTIDAVATPAAGTQIERLPESAFTAVDTFINNGGEFVCWLCGHTHDDFIGVVNNHTNQIQVIVSTGGTSNRYSDCARTKNTKTEDLFNVFTVDGNAKLIKLIRVGSTMDKFMRNRETLCVNYATRQVVSNN